MDLEQSEKNVAYEGKKLKIVQSKSVKDYLLFFIKKDDESLVIKKIDANQALSQNNINEQDITSPQINNQKNKCKFLDLIQRYVIFCP